ncbi:MAG: AMP-binding protein, partial [Chromatocurvus sp.]
TDEIQRQGIHQWRQPLDTRAIRNHQPAAAVAKPVAVPMNGWWTTEELDYGLRDSGSGLVIADCARIERLAPLMDSLALSLIGIDDCSGLDVAVTPFAGLLARHEGAAMPDVPVAADDYATIMYTSGSTGHPKGALSSHRGILSALYSWILMGTVTKKLSPPAADDAPSLPHCGLLTIPLFHCTASHSAFLLSLVTGRKLVIMYKWDVEEALRLIEAEKVTWFTGVPTMSAELQAAARESGRDLSSLAEIFSGGAARPPDQVGKIKEAFGKSSPGIGYGLTETNALGAVNSGAFYIANPYSTGRAVPAVTDIAILDDDRNVLAAGEQGEVCIHSPANCLGYWNRPDATADAFCDGWFHTGDIGYLDDNGFLYIVDRKKEIIIRGGENISCVEVENAIYRHPAVLEVAVFGLPDERLGESVGAAIVLQSGTALDKATLHEHLREHLAAFKLPEHVWFGDEPLPRIASGKIFKRALKTQYAALLEDGQHAGAPATRH